MQTQWDADKNTISSLYSQSQYPNFKQQAKKSRQQRIQGKTKITKLEQRTHARSKRSRRTNITRKIENAVMTPGLKQTN